MELFFPDPTENLLPYDGEAYYHGVVFSPVEIERCMEYFLNRVPWRNDEVVMFGKHLVTARKTAWFSDDFTFYTYSGTTKTAHPLSPELLFLKEKAEVLTGGKYNSCLLNLYHTGAEGMGWHSDNESSIIAGSSIASLSFGARRKFSFKHKRSKETVSLFLEDGGLLDMRGTTQENWVHQLPKTTRIDQPRVNLTFRLMR
ncbi:alpha-ketoglutarate-dependent dioxygenase AlkB family protein [Luteolibacter algae]|uniref:Alpha-ketoglutarate-dependent dioxygenase AlkB family protein n=1 Tax=Luteolibacter algae TaxID=454151 RepID=A0ABW5DA32_9BACT